jgi:anti-anti-sigma factor
MQKLNISITNYPEIPGSQIVYFEGDFDGYAKDNITELQKVIDECTDGCTLIFDLSKLNYLNSYAIGQLVSWHNHVNTLNGKILIVGANKNVEDIFSVLGINSIFKTYATLEELKAENA